MFVESEYVQEHFKTFQDGIWTAFVFLTMDGWRMNFQSGFDFYDYGKDTELGDRELIFIFWYFVNILLIILFSKFDPQNPIFNKLRHHYELNDRRPGRDKLGQRDAGARCDPRLRFPSFFQSQPLTRFQRKMQTIRKKRSPLRWKKTTTKWTTETKHR